MSSTLTGLATHQEDIRKSRFVPVAMPVKTPAQALAFFAAHSVADATHNCWAYRIGTEYRFNDDGEPGGTAGRPILQAIDGQQCDRVAVLVVRWFGGIKLGPGGLMRAYGGLAAHGARVTREAFDAAGVGWLLALPRQNEAAMAEQFTNLTRGRGVWRPVRDRSGD